MHRRNTEPNKGAMWNKPTMNGKGKDVVYSLTDCSDDTAAAALAKENAELKAKLQQVTAATRAHASLTC